MSTKVVLMGAPPDTPNLGVSALGESTLDLLASQIDALHVLQFDFSRNKQATEPVRSGNGALVSHIGSNLSRRFWRSYSVANLNFASRVGRSTHPVIRWMRSASAVLDITGGDSFTDLYGKRRFKGSTLRKEIALRENPNLVLLPQTYGPFREQKSMRIASEIVKQASAAWARDPRSFETLKSMLGEDFDPEIHRSGMDQAFGLDESPCMEELSPSMQAMFENNTSKLLIGLNVSGLIYNDPEAAEVQYGFKVDYGRLIRELIMRINANNDVLFSLVPHVLSPRGIIESDIAACEDVHEWCKSMKIDSEVVSSTLNCRQMKWVINQFDWFCGTRMHSTIAALSGCTPVAAIAYSDKVQGVFDGCNVGDQVADPRVSDLAEMLDRMCDGLDRRDETQRTLLSAKATWSPLLQEQARAIALSVVGTCEVAVGQK